MVVGDGGDPRRASGLQSHPRGGAPLLRSRGPQEDGGGARPLCAGRKTLRRDAADRHRERQTCLGACHWRGRARPTGSDPVDPGSLPGHDGTAGSPREFEAVGRAALSDARQHQRWLHDHRRELALHLRQSGSHAAPREERHGSLCEIAVGDTSGHRRLGLRTTLARGCSYPASDDFRRVRPRACEVVQRARLSLDRGAGHIRPGRHQLEGAAGATRSSGSRRLALERHLPDYRGQSARRARASHRLCERCHHEADRVQPERNHRQIAEALPGCWNVPQRTRPYPGGSRSQDPRSARNS
jgi:hypothetical protein